MKETDITIQKYVASYYVSSADYNFATQLDLLTSEDILSTTIEGTPLEKFIENFEFNFTTSPNFDEGRKLTKEILAAAIDEENLFFETEYMKCYKISVKVENIYNEFLGRTELLIYTNKNNKPIMISEGGKDFAEHFCYLKDQEIEMYDPEDEESNPFCCKGFNHKENEEEIIIF